MKIQLYLRTIFAICFITVFSTFKSNATIRFATDSTTRFAEDSVKNVLMPATVYSAFNSHNKGNKYSYNALEAAASISVIGEPDVLRHISSMPGVSQGIESSLGLFVRGASNGGNGLYFNDIPIYNSSHLFGLFSVFPAEVIERTDFQMGGFSSSRGNLSSSLLDIKVKDKFGKKLCGKVTLSPYLTGGYSAIPLKKDKISLQFAYRTSFLPYFIELLNKEADGFNVRVNDVTAILDYKFLKNSDLKVLYFSTFDSFKLYGEVESRSLNCGTQSISLTWNSKITRKLDLKCLYYKTKNFQNETYKGFLAQQIESSLYVNSKLSESAYLVNVDYMISPLLSVNSGINLQNQQFTPISQRNIKVAVSQNSLYSTLMSLYLNCLYTPASFITAKLGVRYTSQKHNNYSNSGIDWHFLTHIYCAKNFGLEVTYDKMNQYYHSIEGMPTGWSVHLLIPSSYGYPQEITRQAYLGGFWQNKFKETYLNLTIGAYYRRMENVLSYVSASKVFLHETSSWQENVDIGRGKSYGLEISGSIQGRNFGSTLAYTLSKTNRTFAKINKGKTFPFKFDRRHILNLQTKCTLLRSKNRQGKQVERILNNVIAFSSGNRATIAFLQYPAVEPPYWEHTHSSIIHSNEYYNNIYDRQLMSSRNGYKMENYFRIDLAYTLKKSSKKHVSELTFSVFNVFNRHNIYNIIYEDDEWKKVSVVPIMPSIRWSISW